MSENQQSELIMESEEEQAEKWITLNNFPE